MHVTIISDASWCPETRAAGYGYWIACERGKGPGGGSLRMLCSGSNAAEMMAIVRAVADGLKQGFIEPGDQLLIQTDSQAAIDAFTHKRSVGGDERLAYDEMRKLLNGRRITTRFKHVKGHSNVQDARSVTNRMCDQRAKAGMKAMRDQQRGAPVYIDNPFA